MTTREPCSPRDTGAAAPDFLIRVQHHPSRAGLLDRLLPGLAGLPVEVVSDPRPDGPPSAWRTYRQCLTAPHDRSWLVVVQDDAIPADGLADALPKVLAAQPGRVVCLFLAGAPIRTARRARAAAAAGEQWVEIETGDFTPTVATAWPVEIAEELARWGDDNVPGEHRDDDSHVGRFMRNRQPAICTVPSLFQHPDDVPSLTRRKVMGGRNRLRVAAAWSGHADYPWNGQINT